MHLGSFVQMYSEVRYNCKVLAWFPAVLKSEIVLWLPTSYHAKWNGELRKGLIIIYLSFEVLLRIDSHDKGFDIK